MDISGHPARNRKPLQAVGAFLLKEPLLFLIRLYQAGLSPFLVGKCRFYPSCSHYALEVIRSHGAFSGLYYTARRLLRCHPFSAGGVDEPPPPPR